VPQNVLDFGQFDQLTALIASSENLSSTLLALNPVATIERVSGIRIVDVIGSKGRIADLDYIFGVYADSCGLILAFLGK